MPAEDSLEGRAFKNGKLNGNASTPLMDGAKRRDRHDIVVDILKNAQGGIKRTNLMHRAKLSHMQLKLYLRVLNENGLLESNDGFVKTTAKGKQFAQVSESLNFFIFP